MSLKKIDNKSVVAAMSLISVVVFIIILLVTTVRADAPSQQTSQASNVQTFKELVAKMIKEQSIKIQSLFKKIQTNAQTMLQTIQSLKQTSKSDTKNFATVARLKKDTTEVESTIEKSIKANSNYVAPRSFTKHYTTTGYGSTGQGHTGNANYGPPTYHHHSIGFDPINIVVSMSLLSFLLQAIQGLLSRTRTPTPVVEARSLDFVQDWLTTYREKKWKPDVLKYGKYPKKNYFKKYPR